MSKELFQYVFVKNNPVLAVDLLGLISTCVGTGGREAGNACCCGNKLYDPFQSCCCETSEKVCDKVFHGNWRGRCGLFTGGWVFGIGYIACALDSPLNYDCKKWNIGVQAVFVGLTTPGAGGTSFNGNFSGAFGPEQFTGAASLWSVGVSVAGGGSLASLKLGEAVNSAVFQLGIELGAEGMGGVSFLLQNKELDCASWGEIAPGYIPSCKLETCR